MECEERTTIVALAKDLENKNAFVFNSSLGLPSPTNKYKKLLEFFEVSISDINELVSINGEYVYGQFSYFVYEELPYSNYNRKDQKLINVEKKKYIDQYNDSEYPLYNLCLNDNAKVNLEKHHNVNINQIYKDLHYEKLKYFYNQLEKLIDYSIVKSYYLDKSKLLIYGEMATGEISKRFFGGDMDAGIELLLRKRPDETYSKISCCNEIKELESNFDVFIKAFKMAKRLENNENEDFDTSLLAIRIADEYPWKREEILNNLIEVCRDKIISFFDGKNNNNLIFKLNTSFRHFRLYSETKLLELYIETDKKVYLLEKKCYLYALYEKLKDKNNELCLASYPQTNNPPHYS